MLHRRAYQALQTGGPQSSMSSWRGNPASALQTGLRSATQAIVMMHLGPLTMLKDILQPCCLYCSLSGTRLARILIICNERPPGTKTFIVLSYKSRRLLPTHPMMLPTGCRGIGTAEQHAALEAEAQKKRKKKKNAAARRRAQAEEEAAAEQSLDPAEPVGGAAPDDWPAGVVMASQAQRSLCCVCPGRQPQPIRQHTPVELAIPALNVTCRLGPATLCMLWESCNDHLGGEY